MPSNLETSARTSGVISPRTTRDIVTWQSPSRAPRFTRPTRVCPRRFRDRRAHGELRASQRRIGNSWARGRCQVVRWPSGQADTVAISCALRHDTMTGGAATTDPTEAATANRAAWLGFGIGLCIALACAWHAVRDLSWPAEADLYRDLG